MLATKRNPIFNKPFVPHYPAIINLSKRLDPLLALSNMDGMTKSNATFYRKYFTWTCLLFVCGCFPLFLTSCATYPMELSKEQWEALPAEKQAELQAEHYRIQAEERARSEEAARQRAAEVEAAERDREDRLAERMANARYGDVVTVTLQGGAFKWRDRRYTLRPVAFELFRGEERWVELIGQSRNGIYRDEWLVSFSEDGLTIILNDLSFSPPLNLVNSGQWEEGQTVPLNSLGIEKVDRLLLSDMVATIRYKPLPGMPERVIIQNR